MNLKTLAFVACCLAMPAMAGAQDTMAKDSTMSMKKSDKGMKKGKMEMKKDKMDMKKDDMDMKKDDMDMKKDDMDKMKGDNGMKTRTRSRGARRSARGMEMNNSDHDGMAMGNGAECARKCPTSSGAAGLTGVQFLALQQELRDRGCGNSHVTGVLDAPTRAAIKACAKKWDVAPTAVAVLNKMNIGFTAGT